MYKKIYKKVKAGGKWGLVLYMGEGTAKEILPCQYDYIQKPKCGIIIAMKDNRYGLFNKNGEPIVDFVYDNETPIIICNEILFSSQRTGEIDNNEKRL